MSFYSCIEIQLVRSFLFPPEPFSEKTEKRVHHLPGLIYGFSGGAEEISKQEF